MKYSILVATFALMAVACSSSSGATGANGEDCVHVATTVAPITSIVPNIGGDRTRSTGIVPEGTNSHTFEPKPSVAEVLAEADVVFVNGLQLEDPTKELAEANLQGGAPDRRARGRGDHHAGAVHLRLLVPEVGRQAEPAPLDRPAVREALRRDRQRRRWSKRRPRQRRLLPRRTTPAFAGAGRRARPGDAHVASPRSRPAAQAAHLPRRLRLLRQGLRLDSHRRDPGRRTSRTRRRRRSPRLIDQVSGEQVPAIFGSEVFPSPVLEQIGKETGVDVRRRPARRRPARRAGRRRALVARADALRLRDDDRGARRRRTALEALRRSRRRRPTRRTTRSERDRAAGELDPARRASPAATAHDARAARRRPDRRPGAVHRRRRPVRVGQDDAAARARSASSRRSRARSAATRRSASATCPQVETVNWNFPVTVGRVRAHGPHRRVGALPWASAGRAHEVAAVLERLGIGEPRRPPHPRAVRRPAAAGVHRPRAAAPARAAAARRADVRRRRAHPPRGAAPARRAQRDGLAIVLTTHDLNGIAAHLPHARLPQPRGDRRRHPRQVLRRRRARAHLRRPAWRSSSTRACRSSSSTTRHPTSRATPTSPAARRTRLPPGGR